MVNVQKLIEVYGYSPDNWGDLLEFQGDYINYGFWKNISLNDIQPISREQRIESSMALYQEVIKFLSVAPNDIVLEIGCGRGKGLINVTSKVNCKQIIGIDINPAQVHRAVTNIINSGVDSSNIKVLQANAEYTGLLDGSINKIYSIEAAQHFNSLENFAKEAKRILAPQGQLVFATYFPKSNEHYEEMKQLLSFIKEDLENITPVDIVACYFTQAGFKNVTYTPIGEDVFYGYDKWAKQVSNIKVSQSYYKAYKLGYIDYYIFHIS